MTAQTNDALDRAIHGAPVTVSIAGKDRELQYRFAAILAYQERTGCSLLDGEELKKLDASIDPKRWISCLWAGLHQRQADGSWKPALSFDELTAIVGFDPAQIDEISLAMAKAITANLPKPKPKEASPNAAAPVAESQPAQAATSQTSENSGSGPVLVTDSAAPTS